MTTTKHAKSAKNSTAANNNESKSTKMGEGRGGTEVLVQPEYSTCNRYSKQDENLVTSSACYC